MKQNEINLFVGIDDLKDIIEELQNGNGKYLIISKNLFMISNINTCLSVKTYNSWFNKETAVFKFSYDDNNFSNLISVKYEFEDNSVYKFLKNTDYINQDKLEEINLKVMGLMKQTRYSSFTESCKKADEIFKSEALCIITDKINKEDVNLIVEDFNSKLESWKEHCDKLNTEGVKLMNALYDKLITIKLNECL